MSTAVGANLLAHGLHVTMVLAGLWGLAALLLPHALTRLSLAPAASYDEHAERVEVLRAAVGTGTLALAAAPPSAPVATTTARSHPLALPLAVVASTTAAGIHAAVAPPHLREQVLAGVFFLLVAAAQVGWAVRVAGRPTPALLRAGVVLHLGLVATWLATRTVTLPYGLLPEPHPVGPWDLTCVGWQVAAAAACLRTLHVGVPARCPGWFDWHPSSRAAVGAAACSLVLLALSGASS